MKRGIFLFLAPVFLVLAVSALAFLALQANLAEDSYPVCRGCNLVIIELDVLNKNHLSYFGYFRNTTPNLDALAKRSFVFTNAFSAAGFTKPADYSLFTGRRVSDHQKINYLWNSESPLRRLPEFRPRVGLEYLPEVLGERGYLTSAFVSYGLDEKALREIGFDYVFYNEHEDTSHFGDVGTAAREWLGANKGSRFFLFLQGYILHHPYLGEGDDYFDPDYEGIVSSATLDWGTAQIVRGENGSYEYFEVNPETNVTTRTALGQRDIDNIVARYDGRLREGDREIGAFLDALEKSGVSGRTVVIFLSEHGELLGEFEGMFGHGVVHDIVFGIPLFISVPGEIPREFDGPVSSTGVFQTAEAILGFGGREKNLFLRENREIAFFEAPISHTGGNPPSLKTLYVGVRSREAGAIFHVSLTEGKAVLVEYDGTAGEVATLAAALRREYPELVEVIEELSEAPGGN